VPPEPPLSVTEKLQAALLRGLLRLPAPAKRLIAGKPVIRDGQTLDLDIQLFLRVERLQPGPELGERPIADGRRLMLEQARVVGGSQPIGSVQDLEVDGAEGILPARLYVPRAGSDALLVFFHGGGFIYGDLDSHDALCRFLAEEAGVRVLSVEYRLAPEARFPAAYDDCAAAYRWVVKNVDSLGAAPDRLAVGGDSAGGALAAATALVAAREGLPLAFQLLIYPMTDQTNSTDSHAMFSQGYYLTTSFKELGRASYVPRSEDWTEPRVSVLYDDVPQGLAPAYLCTAGFDPLRDEGEAYARKLAEAGVTVELKRFPSFIHGFINMVGLDVAARAATEEVAGKLAAALR
jgi:acetyl esterase